MGQKLSSNSTVPGAPTSTTPPLIWILKGQQKTHNPNPEQPIKFQYKTRRKNHSSNNNMSTKFLLRNNFNLQDAKLPLKSQDAPLCVKEKMNHKQESAVTINRTTSEPNLAANNKRPGKHRRKSSRKLNYSTQRVSYPTNYTNLPEKQADLDKFGYDINDIDQFLATASIEKPANIPVVLSVSTVLYQTRIGGYQEEITLPLGMVVNAIFRNQNWLYVQTPHGEEGYITYAVCIPLGIIPAADDATSPCWETSTDVFPRPSGNQTDTEKLSECSTSTSRCRSTSRRHRTACGERSVDRLYLQAAASAKDKAVQRQTLLVISDDYVQESENTLSVAKGDVVALLSTHIRGWFWVRKKGGEEGFIPSGTAGHGFL